MPQRFARSWKTKGSECKRTRRPFDCFRCEAGQGAPVIGFLGEYDALDGLSQEADVARREPLVEGGRATDVDIMR